MIHTKRSRTKAKSKTVQPERAIILELPIEVHACIVQYLVHADNLQDLLSLNQTCKTLHSDLWSPSSVIWPYIWTVLYGEYSGADQESTRRGRVETSSFKTAVLSRLGLFTDVKRCCRFLLNPTLHHDVTSADEMRSQILRLLAIGTNYDDKSLHWIANTTNSEFWALAVSFWFEMPLQSSCVYFIPETLQRIFDVVARLSVRDPHMLTAFYRDEYGCFQHLRRALFCQEMPSPHWQFSVETAPRTWFPWSMCQLFFLVLFCGPTVCAIEAEAQTRMLSEQALLFQQQEMFWWDSSSSSCDSDDTVYSTSSTTTVVPPAAALETPKHEPHVVPSWLNLGLNAKDFIPIPLISLPKRQIHAEQYRLRESDDRSLTGRWAGYYAYRDFGPDVERESDDDNDDDSDDDDDTSEKSTEGGERVQLSFVHRPQRDLEHSVRGLRLDRRMDLEVVNWTTGSREGEHDGGSGSNNDEYSPLYLNSVMDLQAMKEVDRCFLSAKACHSGGSGVNATCGMANRVKEKEDDCDDLSESENWGHQRIFSGRGLDAIGDYGVRGILSEKTGLFRMVKNYFHHPDEHQEVCHTFSSSDPDMCSGIKNKSLYLEFGSGLDQLSFDLSSGDMIVYYRGMMERGGPGILGLWFDEEISGPFWLYTVSASA